MKHALLLIVVLAGVFTFPSLSHAQTINDDPIYIDILIQPDPSEIDLDDISSCRDIFTGFSLPFSGYCGDRIDDSEFDGIYPFDVAQGDEAICQVTVPLPRVPVLGATTYNYNCVAIRGSASGGGWATSNSCFINNRVPFCNGEIREYRPDGTEITTERDSEGAIEGALEDVGEPILSRLADAGEAVLATAISTISLFILMVANFILGIAGTLFNWVVVKTVFEFSTLIGNSPGLLAAWGILRDIGNMLLLFGFIFIGIATILDLHTYTAKKTLPFLIIFAILMNFSLFIGEAVIDTANGLSVALYNQAGVTTCEGVNVGGTTDIVEPGFEEGQRQVQGCAVEYGISGHIMQSTGISSLFGAGAITTDLPGAVVTLGLAMFATIGAIVLIGATVMLITRAVMLTLLMVTSPVGFAGMAIPPLQKYAKDWWHRLISQSFFAPVLFLFIFISLKITDTLADDDTRGSLAGALTQPGSTTTGVIFLFAIVIGFLIASLMAAKQMGGVGADFAIKAALTTAKSPYTTGRFLAGRGAGLVGRNTIGKYGGKWLQKRYEYQMGKPKPGLLRRALRADLFGADTAITTTLSAARAAKFGGPRGFDEQEKYRQQRKGTMERGYLTMGRERDIEAAIREADNAKTPEALRAANEKIANLLQKMDATEIKALDVLKYVQKGIERLGENMSPEMFERLMKDDELPDDQKEYLKQNRFNEIIEMRKIAEELFEKKKTRDLTPEENERAENAKKFLRRTAQRDLEFMAEYLPDEYRKTVKAQDANYDSLLSFEQMDGLGKSKNVTGGQRQFTKSNTRAGRIETLFDSDPANAKSKVVPIIKKMSDKDLAALPQRILSNPDVVKSLSTSQLFGIAKIGKFRDEKRNILAKEVRQRIRDGDDALWQRLDPANQADLDAYFEYKADEDITGTPDKGLEKYNQAYEKGIRGRI